MIDPIKIRIPPFDDGDINLPRQAFPGVSRVEQLLFEVLEGRSTTRISRLA